MTWIFLIRQWLSSPLHWKEVEAHYFPSCVHVLTETKFKQDEQTMNEKMEQLDRQMQALLKKSEVDLRNDFTRSSTDDQANQPDDPGALNMADPAMEQTVTEAAQPLHEIRYIDAAAANETIAAAEKRIADLVKQINEMNAMKDIHAQLGAEKQARLGAEKRTADMAKQIEAMQAEAARLAAEKQATKLDQSFC